MDGLGNERVDDWRMDDWLGWGRGTESRAVGYGLDGLGEDEEGFTRFRRVARLGKMTDQELGLEERDE